MNEAVDNNAPINQGVDMYGRQKPDLLSPRECAIIAAQAANEKKATDIMVQQVGDLIGVTEYFVICTASNNRQVDAVVDEIEEQCRPRSVAHHRPQPFKAPPVPLADARTSQGVRASLYLNLESVVSSLCDTHNI